MTWNKKLYQHAEDQYESKPRVYYNKKKGRYLVKCGCCEEDFTVFVVPPAVWETPDKALLEINGVLMTQGELNDMIKKMVEEECGRYGVGGEAHD